MSQIADILKAAIEKALGEPVKRVWFEPLGMAMEMCGPSGGWMYERPDGSEDTLGGYNAVQAIEFIILVAKENARTEYEEAVQRRDKRLNRVS